MPLKLWKKLGSKTVIDNGYWCYNRDEFEIEDGHKGEYHYVHTLGSTMVIAAADNKRFILVKQYRYLNQKESIEFPCGSVEKGLAPEENALKELREETGYAALDLKVVGEFAPYTGASDEICKVFIAKDLYKAPLKGDVTEEFEILELTWKEIENMIEKNIIWDGMTIAGWTIAKKILQTTGSQY